MASDIRHMFHAIVPICHRASSCPHVPTVGPLQLPDCTLSLVLVGSISFYWRDNASYPSQLLLKFTCCYFPCVVGYHDMWYSESMEQSIQGKMSISLGSHWVYPNPLKICAVDLSTSITRSRTAFVGGKHGVCIHRTVQATVTKLEMVVAKALGSTPVVELPDGKLS